MLHNLFKGMCFRKRNRGEGAWKKKKVLRKQDKGKEEFVFCWFFFFILKPWSLTLSIPVSFLGYHDMGLGDYTDKISLV